MRTSALLLGVVLLLALAGPAAALEYNMNNTMAFEAAAPEGYSIYQVNLYNLDAGITKINLDAYGQPYAVEVNCTRAWGWWNYDILFTYPDGTTNTSTISTLQPFALDYDLRLQYIVSDVDWIFDVDVYVSILPKTAAFRTLLPTEQGFIWFSSVNGTSPDPMDVRIYLGDSEDIKNIIENNPIWQFTTSLSSIFEWGWNSILWFVEKIPGIGPYFAAALDIMAVILGELSWYLKYFFIDEPEVTICLIEIFCFGDAILRGGDLGKLLRSVAENHIRLLKFAIWLAETAINMVFRAIEVVASIVDALKPV